MTQEMPIRAARTPVDLYLDLLARALTRFGFEQPYHRFEPRSDLRGRLIHGVNRALSGRAVELVRRLRFDAETRRRGKDCPPDAETMIGLERLASLGECVRAICAEGVPGDLFEAGVWRGGACIYMLGALKALGDTDRRVWLADSFEGLPRPSGAYEIDLQGFKFWESKAFVVAEDEIRVNFERYDLWDPTRIRVLKGWFKDTLPGAGVGRIAILRVDGDMFESTLQALESLYPKLSPGGFCIVDDYGTVPGCRAAVDQFRDRHRIGQDLTWVDEDCVYWRSGASDGDRD